MTVMMTLTATALMINWEFAFDNAHYFLCVPLYALAGDLTYWSRSPPGISLQI